MNKVFLSGNLTKDPEIRYTQSGKAMAKMGIAVRRPYASRSAESGQPDTDFFNLTAWDRTAEFCKRYFSKGSRILLEGRVQTYNYEKDGVKHYGVDIVVDNVEFADSKRSGGDGGDRGGYYNKSDNDKSYSNSDPIDDDFSGEDVDTPF